MKLLLLLIFLLMTVAIGAPLIPFPFPFTPASIVCFPVTSPTHFWWNWCIW